MLKDRMFLALIRLVTVQNRRFRGAVCCARRELAAKPPSAPVMCPLSESTFYYLIDTNNNDIPSRCAGLFTIFRPLLSEGLCGGALAQVSSVWGVFPSQGALPLPCVVISES